MLLSSAFSAVKFHFAVSKIIAIGFTTATEIKQIRFLPGLCPEFRSGRELIKLSDDSLTPPRRPPSLPLNRVNSIFSDSEKLYSELQIQLRPAIYPESIKRVII